MTNLLYEHAYLYQVSTCCDNNRYRSVHTRGYIYPGTWYVFLFNHIADIFLEILPRCLVFVFGISGQACSVEASKRAAARRPCLLCAARVHRPRIAISPWITPPLSTLSTALLSPFFCLCSDLGERVFTCISMFIMYVYA